MKRIVIIATFFISLNAADYQEKILQINGRDYLGHDLHETESLTFASIGMRQEISFNLLTQSEDIYTEIAAQGRVCPEYYALCRAPLHGNFALYEDPCMFTCFFVSSSSDSAAKALALCRLYALTHITRSNGQRR